MTAGPSPDPDYRFRSVDCAVHGGNVPGRVPIAATKAGGPMHPPECIACAEAGHVLVAAPIASYESGYRTLQDALNVLVLAEAAIQQAQDAVQQAKIKVAYILGECDGSVASGEGARKET